MTDAKPGSSENINQDKNNSKKHNYTYQFQAAKKQRQRESLEKSQRKQHLLHSTQHVLLRTVKMSKTREV